MPNFVGLLQEKCQKSSRSIPTYDDVEVDLLDPVKKCICKVDNKRTEGFGSNKKMARQNAAERMLELVKNDSFFTSAKEKIHSDTTGLKINVFAGKNGKESPLISEKGKEDNLYVVECKFDGYTAVGRGSSKKAAKENALEEIANHFEIHTFYDNLKKKEERLKNLKPPLQQLNELCSARKLQLPMFSEETVKVDLEKSLHFIVSCTVSSLVTKSNPNFSKKNAKTEAATLMVDKLNETPYFNTPDQSPFQLAENNDRLVVLPEADLRISPSPTCLLPELSYSDEEIPLAKRTKSS